MRIDECRIPRVSHAIVDKEGKMRLTGRGRFGFQIGVSSVLIGKKGKNGLGGRSSGWLRWEGDSKGGTNQ